jgi:hypothetical protein
MTTPTKPTGKCQYSSPFSPGKYITAAQYLAELMCQRIARQESKELPDRFWNLPKWQAIIRKHYTHLGRLTRRFPVEAIIRAFNDKRSQRMISFGNRGFIPIIIDHMAAIKREEANPPKETEAVDTTLEPRKPAGKTAISKLKEFEDKHGL